MTVGNASLGQIVGGKLQGDTVAGQYANTVAAEPAGQVREHGTLLVQLNAELAAGELLNHGSSDFYAIFFAHRPLRV